MSEINLPGAPKEGGEKPEILVNEYGSTRDSAVVIDEANRTVLLTEDETIVIEKEPTIAISPSNRPRKVYGGIWGQAEIMTVGFASLALLAAILFFVFKVIPSSRELETHRSERDRLEAELVSANAKFGSISSTESQVEKVVSSVSDFETAYLPPPSTGRSALYQKLNGLIAAYGLVNTSGPDYAPLEAPGLNQTAQTDEERGRSRFRSLFPGVYVTMTVEGSYINLRRFIREIETGREFVIVSTVELAPSEGQNQNKPNQPSAGNQPAQMGIGEINLPYQQSNPIQAAQPQVERRQGKVRGETVALKLEMAAYFRRPDFVPPEPSAETK